MNYTKKIRNYILIIIIIIVILLLLLLLLLPKEKGKDKVESSFTTGDLYDYDKNEAETLTGKVSFYTVSNCVTSYLDIINKNNSLYFGYDEKGNYAKVIDDETIAENIINILSKEYIQKII